MVTTTGRTRPSCPCVWALNPLQNSMMFTPCCPSAGPTGGEGFAFPAGICSFTIACTFFAMSEPLDLVVLEFHGGQPSEDGHHDLQLAALGIEVVDRPLEVHERPLDDPHLVPFLERRLQLRLLSALLHLAEDALHFREWKMDGLGAGAHEAGHFGRGADEVPGLIRHLHLDEEIAREEFLLRLDLLALANLADLLVRDDDPADHVLQPEDLRARLDGRGHLVLETRVRMDHVPLLGGSPSLAHFKMTPTMRESPTSTALRYRARMNTTASTTVVDLTTSARLGQFTRRNSAATSRKNCWTRPRNSMLPRNRY